MSKARLCREYGISRPTGDKWIKRYHSGEGYADRSKVPFRSPNKIPREMEEAIILARRKEPAIGAVKIERMMRNEGHKDVPCASTINAVLKRNDLITREASLAAMPCKRFEQASPNVMWQADFKGHYGLKNGARCHPLSILDDHSRFCLCADAKEDEKTAGTQASFIQTFRMFGLPEMLLCDNGNPWGTSQSAGYTIFEVWLMEMGILPIHIRAKHPQTQGKVEKFNRSFKDERLKFRIPQDMEDAQKQREEYRNFYNNERPHHALRLDAPAKHYKPSDRLYKEEISTWDYSTHGNERIEIRSIKPSGYLTYQGQGYFFSEAFGGKSVALKASSVDGYVNVIFREFRVGRISLREKTVISRKAYLLRDDPRTS
jgi:transposase InsO family protein